LTTLAFLIPSNFTGVLRIVLYTSVVVGFGAANFRVFQNQQQRIDDLTRESGFQEQRLQEVKGQVEGRQAAVASLTVHPVVGSRYILHPTSSVPHADFDAGYFEFHLRVENSGTRNSSINDYQIEITELHQQFPHVVPQEGRNGIQGRHCQHGLAPGRILSETRIIRVDADSTTNEGTLLFFVPGLSLERFVTAGLHMHGEQRLFDSLHCRLTLTDTNGASASADFEMAEH
jgi:hypothetical protein